MLNLTKLTKLKRDFLAGVVGVSPLPELETDEEFDCLSSPDSRLADLGFKLPLRRYQEDILGLLEEKLARGERRFHVVAPPGAGKTIIGLQIVSRFKCPSLILSPNTTIQSQWGQKMGLFMPSGLEAVANMDILGTHEDKPLKPVTLLTYQVLSTPEREHDYFHRLSHQAWVSELTRGRSISVGDAELRILELLHNNPKAYKKETSRHVSRLRKQLTEVLDLKEVLHKNALGLLQSMRRQNFGLVIFDECHHLTDYWAAIMTHLVKQLGNPLVIGLTGTPPEGKTASQERRYLSLVGDIDYQVPTPALVREGGLAPFQDLAYFTEPTEKEFQFLKEQHHDFQQIVRELTVIPGHDTKANTSASLQLNEAKPLCDSVNDKTSATRRNASAAQAAVTRDDLLLNAELTHGEHGGNIAYSDDLDESSVIDSSLHEELLEKSPHAPDTTSGDNGAAADLSDGRVDSQSDLEPDGLSDTEFPSETIGFDSPLSDYLEKAKIRARSKERIDSLLGVPGERRQLLSDDDAAAVLGFQLKHIPASAPLAAYSEAAAIRIVEPEPPPLTAWVRLRINEIVSSVPEDPSRAWRQFAQDNADLSAAIHRYMQHERQTWELQLQLEQSDHLQKELDLDDWMLLLEDFASRKLKLSKLPSDHQLFARIQAAARKLGYAITERGLRRQASPVDRILAFSHSKPEAVIRIIEVEYRSLEDRLRVAVVTDFERMSATAVKPLSKAVKDVITDETGGAMAVLRTLLSNPVGLLVNPCLVTGSLLLIDKRVAAEFVKAGTQWLRDEGYKFDLIAKSEESSPYSSITASSTQWESRLYVGMATAIFERGITKCLIGTRGLFGEGWDSQALNTLIDLTNTTSPVSVKQLRGRSIRIQTNDPLGQRKCANNWDVVCIAPSLEKGLNDYHRFVRKHEGYFGICDDGQIECGVGHVHGSLASLSGVEVFASSQDFNEEMTDRALVRESIYDLWKVGQPYNNQSIGCVELNRLRKLALTPPHIKRNVRFKEHAHLLRSSLRGVWFDHLIVGSFVSGALFSTAAGGLGMQTLLPVSIAGLPLIIAALLAKRQYTHLFKRLQEEICRPNTQQSSLEDISYAVLTALQAAKLLPETLGKANIECTLRPDGSYRVLLREVSSEHSRIFTNSLKEVLAPLTSQPYVIPKFEYFIDGENELAQKKEERFFRSYLRGRAEPRVACYHAVPSLLARSQKSRQIFEGCWNKYVSPGFVLDTEVEPQILNRYFGLGPSLAQRLLWE
jgi:superfamily II DNA or RNA helicase